MRETGIAARRVALRTLALLLAAAAPACTGERISLPGFGGDAPPPAPALQPAPSINMAGRWTLAQPGRGQCAMTFRTTPQPATEGTIAPEGGCPGQFFTSRKWAFEGSTLVIKNHNSQELARLNMAGGVRFDGQSTAGQPVTLTR